MLSVDAFLKTSSSLVLFVTQSALVSICCDVVINISIIKFNSRFAFSAFLRKGVG